MRDYTVKENLRNVKIQNQSWRFLMIQYENQNRKDLVTVISQEIMGLACQPQVNNYRINLLTLQIFHIKLRNNINLRKFAITRILVANIFRLSYIDFICTNNSCIVRMILHCSETIAVFN